MDSVVEVAAADSAVVPPRRVTEPHLSEEMVVEAVDDPLQIMVHRVSVVEAAAVSEVRIQQ